MDNFDLFFEPVPPNVRTPDMPASIEAGDAIEMPARSLRESLLWHIEAMQPITSIELEELPLFQLLAPSTVRKRVSELKAMGRVFEGEVVEFTSERTKRTHRATAWWTRRQDGVQ